MIRALLIGSALLALAGFALGAYGLWRLNRWLRSEIDAYIERHPVGIPYPRPRTHVYPLGSGGPYEHRTTGEPCWCGPETRCGECDVPAPCIHGTDRAETVVHRRPA